MRGGIDGDYMKKTKKMLLIALVDAITTQIYIDMFVGGFRIGISVIILPIFYYFDRKINPLICAFFVGVVGLLFRGVIGITEYGSFLQALQLDSNIFVFDICYGLFYYFLFYKSEEKSLTRWALVILFADFIANTLEIVSRAGPFVSGNIGVVDKLFVVASTRTLIGVIVVLILNRYQMLLKREEHENRYRQLVTMLSDLKSEVYFMSNNMENIEAVMSDAFVLYENLEDGDEENRQLSLQIAKDVHEIKKNYLRVIHGIDQISEKEPVFDIMPVKDIYAILLTSVRREVELKNLPVTLDFNIRCSAVVSDHFLLMSILRNLVMNAVEAMESSGGVLSVRHEKINGEHRIYIIDNGPGIKEKDMDYIFDPGFSTKFDEETGTINRGIGLTLVRDIVEKQFKGQISVQSELGSGTTFEIVIPEKGLEATI